MSNQFQFSFHEFLLSPLANKFYRVWILYCESISFFSNNWLTVTFSNCVFIFLSPSLIGNFILFTSSRIIRRKSFFPLPFRKKEKINFIFPFSAPKSLFNVKSFFRCEEHKSNGVLRRVSKKFLPESFKHVKALRRFVLLVRWI